MNEPTRHSGASDPLRTQAATEWILRLNDAPTDEHVIDGWLTWCDEHPDNREAFERMQNLWHTTGQVPLDRRLRRELAATRSPRRWLGGALAAGLAAASVFAVVILTSAAPTVETFSTATAMHSSAVLADGSSVELGAETQLTAVLSRRQRQVRVEAGEAFFHVVEDRERPFVVEAGPLRVTAVGTAFNIRRVASRVIVTVADGEVDIVPTTADAAPIRAAAGRQAILDLDAADGDGRLTLATVDPEIATSWRDGVLRFENEPLAYVIDNLNRYSKRALVIADPPVGRMSYTGAVFTDRIDDWLLALESVFPVQVTATTEGDDAVLLTSRPANVPR